MVAVSGTGWRLAPSLVALVDECNRIAPNRSTASDGSIGDTAHAARTSDHNPSGGYVCAVDITDDKPGGLDADLLARHIVAGRDPRVKYVIWNGTIVQAAKGWVPEPYRGPNAHFQHTHVSIHNTATARNDKSPWFPKPPQPPPPQEDDMAKLDEEDRQWLRNLATDMVGQRPMNADAGDHRSDVFRWTKETTEKIRLVSALVVKMANEGDDVDEARVAQLVLAGLDPAAIAAAIPDDLAERVADEIHARLAG